MDNYKRILFLGSKEIGFKSLSTLHSIGRKSIVGIVTIDDTIDDRSVLKKFSEFSKLHKIPIDIAKNREDADTIVRRYKPDLCVVVGWYWLIKKEILDSVPGGFIGIHNSLLPKYRGGSPLVWAIINGEKKIGLSLFSFSEGMDDGPIWGQRTIEISNNESVGKILRKLENESIEILKEKYPLILNNSIKPVSQNDDDATYCAQRIPDDGEIDWSKSSMEIHNFIRAQSKPYPGAFTFFKGGKLIITNAYPLDITYYGTPGQVARIDSNGVCVICGNQKPILLTMVVKFDSNEEIAAQEIIKSINTRFIFTCRKNFK